MPVIAFNASAKIAEWYGDIQKGKRSKVINNRLERALRLDSQPIEIMSAQSLEDSLKSHREQIEKLQDEFGHWPYGEANLESMKYQNPRLVMMNQNKTLDYSRVLKVVVRMVSVEFLDWQR